MIKSLVIKLFKNYLIDAINELLCRYQNNISEITKVIELWIKRLQIIIEELKNILSRVTDDNKIDDKDIKESVKEISEIIKNW